MGGFHLHLLVFPFVYQINLTFHLQMTSSKGFQQHFTIISKFISFAVLKSDDCLSVELPFELPVQLLVELEPNLLVQHVIELEFETIYNVDETN